MEVFYEQLTFSVKNPLPAPSCFISPEPKEDEGLELGNPLTCQGPAVSHGKGVTGHHGIVSHNSLPFPPAALNPDYPLESSGIPARTLWDTMAPPPPMTLGYLSVFSKAIPACSDVQLGWDPHIYPEKGFSIF